MWVVPGVMVLWRNCLEAYLGSLNFLQSLPSSDPNLPPTFMAPRLYSDMYSPLSMPSAAESTPCRLRLIEDVIIQVFRCYRLDLVDEVNWNLERWWHKLTHVCRTWRYLILTHQFHLDLHLVCTYGTPITDMLALSPSFPLIINYPNQNAEITTEDEEGLFIALQHRKRVDRISLMASNINYNSVLTAMDGDFPELQHLRITSGITNEPTFILPPTFRAPRLSSLIIIYPAHPTRAPLSLTAITAIHLVRLKIRDISPSPDFHPEYLVSQLSFMPLLATVSLGFRSPTPNRVIEKQLLSLPMTRITLPHLTSFRFWGVSSFLESLLARISAPLLGEFSITFFNQLTFSLPHLSRFIGTTPRLKLSIARIIFKEHSVSIIVDDNGLHRLPGFLRIEVGCQYHGWQVDAIAQICNAIAPVLAVAQELTLRFRKHGISSNNEDEVNLTKWHDLLRPFTCVEILRVHPKLVRELSCALKTHDGECPQDVLPRLCELVLPSRREYSEAFVAFLNTRRTSGRPIRLRLRSQLPIDQRHPPSSTDIKPTITWISQMRNTSHTSWNPSAALDTHIRRTRVIPEHRNPRTPVLRDAVNHANRTTVGGLHP